MAHETQHVRENPEPDQTRLHSNEVRLRLVHSAYELKHAAMLGAFVLLASACVTAQPISPKTVVNAETNPVSADELRVNLTRYSDRLVFLLDQSTQAIKEATDDVSRKRLVLAWKIQMATFIRQTMALREPGEAMVDMWAFAIQIDQLFRVTEPDPTAGVTKSRAQQARAALLSSSPVPARNAREALAQIDDLARRVIKTEDFERVRNALVEFAKHNPLVDMEGPETPEINLVTRPVDDRSFGWITELLTTPARIFLNDTAQAIEGFSRTGEKFTEIVKLVPEQFSWRMEMIAYDLEHGDTAVATRHNLGLFTKSSEAAVARIAALPADLQVLLDRTIETLPTKVRQEAVRGVEELLEHRETLDQTLEKVREVLASADAVTHHSSAAATAITDAGTAWEGAFGELRGMVNDGRDDDVTTVEPPTHPFDVRDYGNSAREITLAGDALRGAVVETRALITDAKQLDATISRTRVQFDGAIEDTRRRFDDTVRLWIYLAGAVAAGLMVLAFALALVLRRITRHHA